MNLVWWLIILCGVLVWVRLFDEHRRARRAAALTAIAREARMNYSQVDRFDLSRRLQRSALWTAGLHVRDVLYSTQGEHRLFVATAERRATPDDRPRHFVIACAEPLDHSELKTLVPPVQVRGRSATLDAYRATVDEMPS